MFIEFPFRIFALCRYWGPNVQFLNKKNHTAQIDCKCKITQNQCNSYPEHIYGGHNRMGKFAEIPLIRRSQPSNITIHPYAFLTVSLPTDPPPKSRPSSNLQNQLLGHHHPCWPSPINGTDLITWCPQSQTNPKNPTIPTNSSCRHSSPFGFQKQELLISIRQQKPNFQPPKTLTTEQNHLWQSQKVKQDRKNQ